jgi:hypothetical protein
LAAVVGDGIAVIEMRVLPDFELDMQAGVQPNLENPFAVDPLDGSELAVSNVLGCVEKEFPAGNARPLQCDGGRGNKYRTTYSI